MYNEVLIKYHILNSFSKENDSKMQNKMLKYHIDLEDPRSRHKISTHQRNLRNKKINMADEK